MVELADTLGSGSSGRKLVGVRISPSAQIYFFFPYNLPINGMSKPNNFYVYILISLKDNNIYIGFTSNIINRIKRHNKGFVKSTKSRRPFKLIYLEKYYDRQQALGREKYLKTTQGRRFIYKGILGR